MIREVIIDKYDIPLCGELKGSVNAKPFHCNGSTYSAGTLRYVGFVGLKDSPGKWKGTHRFLPADGVEGEKVDFNELPGCQEKRTTEVLTDGDK